MDLATLRQITVGDALARDVARMEEERASWRKSMIETDNIAKRMRELAEGSAEFQAAKNLLALQSSVFSVAQQHKDLLGLGGAFGSAYEAWQDSQRTQTESMRKMFAPMVDIRNSVLGDSTMTQQLIKELTEASSARNYFADLVEQASGVGSVAKLLAQQGEASRAQTKHVLESLNVSSSVQRYLNDYMSVNKGWVVPREVLGMVDSFKEIHDRFGNFALPTIDWGSAAALAKVLGREGIQQQLNLLGIEPDGSMHSASETPASGILGRRQSDAVALLSLLLSILFFIYQESSNTQQQVKTDAFQTQAIVTLQMQAKQIQSLTILIEKALVQAAQAPEERFVVRDRVATVRARPTHGSTVEGTLMPNEVVRVISKDGKWVEVEYYHWLREQYRVGWVLKKYLERVPANFSKNSG